jgi:hypothetical protein
MLHSILLFTVTPCYVPVNEAISGIGMRGHGLSGRPATTHPPRCRQVSRCRHRNYQAVQALEEIEIASSVKTAFRVTDSSRPCK